MLEIVLLRGGGWTKCSSELPARKHFYDTDFLLSQSSSELCLTVTPVVPAFLAVKRKSNIYSPTLQGHGEEEYIYTVV